MFPRAFAVSRLGTAAPYAALLLVATFLIFPRLADRYLWEDEAETALLARNVLRFGVPLAWDGRDLISQECGADHDGNYLWRHTPWLPIYVVAGSFAALGPTTLAARLPFALLGLASIASVMVLARVAFRDRATGLLAGLVLTLSVPFLLHVRQARYYGLAILATIWLLVAFFATLERRRFAAVGFAVALSVLFQSNYLLAAATGTGLAASLLVLRPDRAAIERLGAATLAAAMLNAPWLFLLDLRGKGELAASFTSATAAVHNLARYAGAVELHAFPSLVLAPALALTAWNGRETLGDVLGVRRAAALVALSAVHLLVLALAPFVFYRYFMNLLPVFALLTAWTVRALGRRSVALAAVVLVLVLFVDRADAARLTPGSTLVKYVDEITHEVDGPIRALVRYLRDAAQPGERIFVSYGDLALRFYTDLEVRGGTGCQSLEGWPPPDWLVVRYFLRLNPISPAAWQDSRDTVRRLNAWLASREYRHIELATVDTVHDNLPEPDLHVYRTRRTGPRVTLFRRVAGSAAIDARPR